MKIETHRGWEYVVANLAGRGYRPGFVNEVAWRRSNVDGRFTVQYTDGYKTQHLCVVSTREGAIAAARDALDHGAGGGFTSRFRPNTETAPPVASSFSPKRR